MKKIEKSSLSFAEFIEVITKNKCDLEKIKEIHKTDPIVFTTKDEKGENLLHWAIRNERVEFAKWLCDEYIHLMQEKNQNQWTPMSVVLSYYSDKKLEIINHFFKVGGQVPEPLFELGPFYLIMSSKDGKRTMDLFNAFMNGRPELIYQRNYRGETPLEFAKRIEAYADIIFILGFNEGKIIEKGLNTSITSINTKDKTEKTFNDLLDYLKKNNWDLAKSKEIYEYNKQLFQSSNEDGDNLLHHAILHVNGAFVRWLFDLHPTLMEQQSKNRVTPFERAVNMRSSKEIENIKYFLNKKEFQIPNLIFSTGPFLPAIKEGRIELVRVFIEARPELINQKNYQGETPLEFAKSKNALNLKEMIPLLTPK